MSAPPFTAADAVERRYSRLNADYATLHALCRFFLEHTGPTHDLGGHRMLPFEVDMAALFERFVAAWLRVHLPPDLALRTQETVAVGGLGGPRFRIDLVVRERQTGRAVCVMDTKYKAPGPVDPADVAQAVTYAELKGVSESALVYPGVTEPMLDATVGAIRIRSLAFDIGRPLDLAGSHMLAHMLEEDPALSDQATPAMEGEAGAWARRRNEAT